MVVSLLGFSATSSAQFREDIYEQNYNSVADTTFRSDTTKRQFTFKEYFGALAHKNTMKIGITFASSAILPGTAQIYNKDYWKLPIIYGGIGALGGTGGYYLSKYKKTQKAYDDFMVSKNAFETVTGVTYPFEAPVVDMKAKKTGTWLIVGAGLIYWGQMLDGIINYETEMEPHPGRAAIYSALLPGLGQIYNGEFYKVPIYWGGLMACTYFLTTNNMNYKRFKTIHNEATNPEISYTGPISGETAKWYRDVYRRYRDYSIVATILVYALQVIDANVFAYMHDFEVTDELTMNIEPTVIAPDEAYAFRGNTQASFGQNAVGLKLGFKF